MHTAQLCMYNTCMLAIVQHKQSNYTMQKNTQQCNLAQFNSCNMCTLKQCAKYANTKRNFIINAAFYKIANVSVQQVQHAFLQQLQQQLLNTQLQLITNTAQTVVYTNNTNSAIVYVSVYVQLNAISAKYAHKLINKTIANAFTALKHYINAISAANASYTWEIA